MSYNPENADTYFYIDDWGMVMTQPLWKGDEGKERDSILRTAWAYKAWGDKDLLHGVQGCSRLDKKGRIIFYRHPTNSDNDMSRDHIIGAILIQKFENCSSILKWYANKLKWRISEKFCFTPDLWAWMKILAGKWWWWIPFVLLAYPTMTFNMLKNKLIYRLAEYTPEKHQLNWYPRYPLITATQKQRILRRRLFPTYALYLFAWQLYVLPRNVFVRGLQKIALKMVGRYNYLIRLLLDDPEYKTKNGIAVIYQAVNKYRQMTNWRWATTLNETCDRHVEIVKKDHMNVANRLEEDLLKKIWDETRKS